MSRARKPSKVESMFMDATAVSFPLTLKTIGHQWPFKQGSYTPGYAQEAAGGGGVQGCPAFVVAAVHVRPVGHQELHHVQVVVDTCLETQVENVQMLIDCCCSEMRVQLPSSCS